jgi:predicted kinase
MRRFKPEVPKSLQPDTIYIIRGLPGSGKSTLAKRLTPGYVFSADDYFTDPLGAYNFVAEELGAAHHDCLERVSLCMSDQVRCSEEEFGSRSGDLSVANTFTRYSEVEPYLELAYKNSFTPVILVCTNSFGSEHNVPQNTIRRMMDRWEDFILTIDTSDIPELLN